uniref:H15 domain-containing protein n=1 Tax=Physcomitrium patens TaxID=3218 RepID=A0A2K1IC72_PHYPA|nr:hypothetical protein PHYPA_030348 [Physcomitrium patens]
MKNTMATSASKSLIRDAMVHLKKRNGASFAQLRKHLESNYAAKLDANKRKLLSSALKSMVQSGSVEKKGAVYKLGVPTAQASKGPAEIAVPSRRRRRKSSKSLKVRHKRKGGKRRRHRRRRSKRTKSGRKGHRRHRRSKRCKKSKQCKS